MREALLATLLFDVLSQYFYCRSTAGNQAVGAMPKYWISVYSAQMPFEVPPDQSGRSCFQIVDQFTQLRKALGGWGG
jgi:hypothetical protein